MKGVFNGAGAAGILAICAGSVLPAAAFAQPADLPIPAATTDVYPPGVRVLRTKAGPVYADAKGHTLYGMDMRVLLRFGPNPATYCKDECAQQWEPLLAPAGSKPNVMFQQGFGRQPLPAGFVANQSAPDWGVIDGPLGPQWIYKGWHMVYTRKGDQPGSTAYEGAEDKAWNTLKFVPPVPKPVVPLNVGTIFANGAYALSDKDGKVLFTGSCGKRCTWRPFTGGYASRGVGEWKVAASAEAPQWRYRGKPVYVTQEDDPARPPSGGQVLRP